MSRLQRELKRLQTDLIGFGPIRNYVTAEQRERRRRQRELKNQNERNRRNIQKFLNKNASVSRVNEHNGNTEYIVNLELTTNAQIQGFLDEMLPHLERGERFVLGDGDQFFTLTNETFVDIQRWLTTTEVFGDTWGSMRDSEGGSDEPMQDAQFYSNMQLISFPRRTNRTYDYAHAAFFPYTHNFDCPDLTNELANLGCWKEVIRENYDNNCLYNAFKSAGVSEDILNAMKTQFLRRTISRKNLEEIALLHGLFIEISTDVRNSTTNDKKSTKRIGIYIPWTD